MRVTLKKRKADVAFDASDALRQRWLSDVEPRGCSSELACLRDGDHVAQMAKLDRHTRSLYGSLQNVFDPGLACPYRAAGRMKCQGGSSWG